MQLLSNKSAPRVIEEPSTSEHVARKSESQWEGFGEENSEDQFDASRLKGTVPLEKDTCKPKTKPRKQEKKQKKRSTSRPEITGNTFGVLDRADEDEDIVDDEESDGKQKRMIERISCS